MLFKAQKPTLSDHLHWIVRFCRLGRSQVWLYAGNPRSWDSRYWRPASVTDILARAVPILVPARSSDLRRSRERGR